MPPSSTVTSIFNAAESQLNDLFGETGTYTPDGGTASTITIRIDRNIMLDNERLDGIAYHAVGYVLVSEVPTPGYLDKISTTGPGGNSEEWTVINVLASDQTSHKLALRDDLRPDLNP